MSRITRLILFTGLSCALGIGCRNDPPTAPVVRATSDVPSFPSSPTAFAAQIDNPYLAFAPGRVFHYRSETPDGVETSVVQITNKTKRILGIAATVVHDQVYVDGALVEDTFDWYAQDAQGNVWYLGEDSKQIQNGVVVGTEGSWQAGVNGAEPGIVMLAHPKAGVQYRQEFAAGIAEDMAKVLNLSVAVQTNLGSFAGCLKTEEWTALEPGARESKYYKPGVGLVLDLQPKGGGIRDELTAIEN